MRVWQKMDFIGTTRPARARRLMIYYLAISYIFCALATSDFCILSAVFSFSVSMVFLALSCCMVGYWIILCRENASKPILFMVSLWLLCLFYFLSSSLYSARSLEGKEELLSKKDGLEVFLIKREQINTDVWNDISIDCREVLVPGFLERSYLTLYVNNEQESFDLVSSSLVDGKMLAVELSSTNGPKITRLFRIPVKPKRTIYASVLWAQGVEKGGPQNLDH